MVSADYSSSIHLFVGNSLYQRSIIAQRRPSEKGTRLPYMCQTPIMAATGKTQGHSISKTKLDVTLRPSGRKRVPAHLILQFHWTQAQSILECAIPLCLPTSQLWILDECLNLILERKRLVNTSTSSWYRQLNREVWQKLKAEWEAYWNYVTIDLEEIVSWYKYRVLNQILRRQS